MSFKELCERRRSVRKYKADGVDRTLLAKLFTYVSKAPSAHNSQGYRFIVIDGPEDLKSFRETAFSGIFKMQWVNTAPVIVAMVSSPRFAANVAGKALTGIDYKAVDAGIAGEHLVLAAAENGLSTCWIGWFNKKKTSRWLRLSKGDEIMSLFSLGYADEEWLPREQKRKPMEELFSFYESGR